MAKIVGVHGDGQQVKGPEARIVVTTGKGMLALDWHL
jgi:hypothetical protein